MNLVFHTFRSEDSCDDCGVHSNHHLILYLDEAPIGEFYHEGHFGDSNYGEIEPHLCRVLNLDIAAYAQMCKQRDELRAKLTALDPMEHFDPDKLAYPPPPDGKDYDWVTIDALRDEITQMFNEFLKASGYTVTYRFTNLADEAAETEEAPDEAP